MSSPPTMSSDDEAPRIPPRPVTLSGQADAAAEIVCTLAEHKIKVIASGTSGCPVFELAYDQPQNVDIKVHPAWLRSQGRIVRSTGVKVPVSSPRTILLDLLCSTADSFECNAVEQAYCDLSALYVFLLLVSCTTVDGKSSSPFISMDWTHEAWVKDYAEHLRTDDKLADQYADARRMLKYLDVDEHLSEAGLRRWATWLLDNVDRQRRVPVEDTSRSRSPGSDPRIVAERMSTFLHRVKAMVRPPRYSSSPET
ncbi:hypothetical protein JCM3775_006007 [Rhodotorula graminis]